MGPTLRLEGWGRRTTRGPRLEGRIVEGKMAQIPILRYYGAKWKIAKWIVQHFPPHDIYVEPFAGSAAVLFHKEESALEVLNDIDDDVVNFLRAVRDAPERLATMLYWTPYSEAEYRDGHSGNDDEPFERARRFAVRAWMSIGGHTAWRGGFRWRRDKTMRHLLRRWECLPEGVLVAAERLRRVLILRKDYRDVVTAYDGSRTLFYFDPPYLPSTRSPSWRRGAYRYDWSENDHIAFIELLHQIRGAAVVSGYASQLYAEALERRGWVRLDKVVINGNGRMATESLWVNPTAQEALTRPRQISLFFADAKRES